MTKGKKIAVGDPVLWFGFNLHVVKLLNASGVQLAEVKDVEGAELRDAARAEIHTLRQLQADPKVNPDDWEKAAARIKELDEKAREVTVRARLRIDLLSYWEERGVWVLDGRILTDEQQKQFQRLTGNKVRPDQQRDALLMLESTGKEG